MSKVSIIIATYNHGSYIREAIESVLVQTWEDREIIVIDDGSTDLTREIIREYIENGSVQYVYQSNKGLSAARNAGLKLATGEYVKFLDSDDFLCKEQIEKQCQDLETNGSDISISNYNLLTTDGLIKPGYTTLSLDDSLASYIYKNSGPAHALLIKKMMINKVGGFDESLTSYEDYDLWLRLLLAGAIVSKTDYVGCCYRLFPESMSTDQDNMFKQKCRIFEKLNQAFARQKAMFSEKAVHSLLWSNTKLIHQCLYRKWDLDQYLPHALNTIEEIYRHHNGGLKIFLYKNLGAQRFFKLQLWKYRWTKSEYRHELKYGDTAWRLKH